MIGLADLVRIILAVILGGIIGYEREISGKSAGLRTNVLICMGAALFTVLAKHMGDTRIAAQVVTGVGFLGAGAIIQDRGGVHGLTTAATIWLVASIGMACGAGFYGAAAIVTLLAVLVLLGLTKLENPHSDQTREATEQAQAAEQPEQVKQVEQVEPEPAAPKPARKAAKRRKSTKAKAKSKS